MSTRCSCRPGCLTWLRPDDNTTVTPAGRALVDHVTVVTHPRAVDPDVVFQAASA